MLAFLSNFGLIFQVFCAMLDDFGHFWEVLLADFGRFWALLDNLADFPWGIFGIWLILTDFDHFCGILVDFCQKFGNLG